MLHADPLLQGLPPGPSLPPIVQSMRWLLRPIPFMDECARRFGDTFTLRAFRHPPMVFLSHPDDVKAVFTADPDVLHAGEANSILKPSLGENSLLVLDGERHLRQRKLLLPPLHGERMHAYGEAMVAAADRAIARWPMGRPFSLHEETQSLTLEVILETVFGLREGPRRDGLRALLVALMDFGTRSPLLLLLIGRDGRIAGEELQAALGRLSPWGQFRALVERLDAALFDEIRRRREEDGEGREDVLALLLAARDEAGEPMSDVEIRDELLTLLTAGHETTATTITFVVNRLLDHPEVAARLRDEIRRLAGDDPRAPILPHLGRLEYLDAVIKETMRLDPVAPLVARLVKRPITVGGRIYRPGVMLMPCVYLTHRRADLYPEPERFLPERFLDRKAGPYELYPFGGGARRCVGMAFALYELKVVLARVLGRTRLSRPSGERPRVVRRAVTLALAGGLPVRLEARVS